jgi:hypothetical protein
MLIRTRIHPKGQREFAQEFCLGGGKKTNKRASGKLRRLMSYFHAAFAAFCEAHSGLMFNFLSRRSLDRHFLGFARVRDRGLNASRRKFLSRKLRN